ncbi:MULTISPECIES: ABC transporter permease [Clostridium]|uniref:ABC transporter permease n=1 Tax=Clostridium TaxID=1485 RepID=UPI000824916E|nr:MULTISPECIES: ABC-2 family transporter protein [Clostridium]PJI06521.1 hypothetical protein CUB90_00955 [Clostridium sp. CT7]
MRYIKIFISMAKVFFKTSIQQEIAFRFDFFVKVLNSLLVIVGSIGGILILFTKVPNINGWSFYEILAVTGMFMFMQSFKNLFIAPSLSSISGLGGELWTGSFDFTLLKPIPIQMYISIKNWAPLTLIDLVISIIVLAIAIFNMSKVIILKNVILLIVALFIALVVLYSVMLILTSAAFWYLGTPLLWIFDSLMELGRYPVNIYPIVFKNILTWIIPVGIITTMPVEALLGKIYSADILLELIFSITIYVVSVYFFKQSIKKYSSASS